MDGSSGSRRRRRRPKATLTGRKEREKIRKKIQLRRSRVYDSSTSEDSSLPRIEERDELSRGSSDMFLTMPSGHRMPSPSPVECSQPGRRFDDSPLPRVEERDDISRGSSDMFQTAPEHHRRTSTRHEPVNVIAADVRTSPQPGRSDGLPPLPPPNVRISPQPGRSDGLPARPRLHSSNEFGTFIDEPHHHSSSQASTVVRTSSFSGFDNTPPDASSRPGVAPYEPGRRGRPPILYRRGGERLPLTGIMVYGAHRLRGESEQDMRQRCRNEKKSRAMETLARNRVENRGRALRRNEHTEMHYLGPRVKCPKCGSLNFKAEETSGRAFDRQVFTICCNNGKVRLPPIPQDDYIQRLLTDIDDPAARHFRNNIRNYNTALGFASIQFNEMPEHHPNLPDRQGPFVFHMHGMAYHRIVYPRPRTDGVDAPRFGQLYYLDPQMGHEHRLNMDVCRDLDRDMLQELDARIRERNVYAQQFCQLRQYEEINLQQIRNDARSHGDPDPQRLMAHLVLFDRVDQNRGTHGADVQGNDVVIMYAARDGEPLPISGMVVRPHNPTTQDPHGYRIIPNASQALDPLCYPLMRPYGTPGWSCTLTSLPVAAASATAATTTTTTDEAGGAARQKISFRQYCIYNLMDRSDDDGGAPLLNFGRLLQQMICDWAHRMEQMKLAYVKRKQKSLRAVTAAEILDAGELLDAADDNLDEDDRILVELPVEGVNADHANIDMEIQHTIVSHPPRMEIEEPIPRQVGVRVLLPSAFSGSPRNMNEKYADAMAMMAQLGKPDLFITMSCNPAWKEIEENLKPHMKPEDQSLLACRVFRLKVADFRNQLETFHIFGRVRYYTYSIEFQKRGLPHAHFLIALHPDDKMTTAEQVDNCISAEIPVVETANDTRYSYLVKKHMMHGPCGPNVHSKYCWKEGRCTKRFPKDFVPSTFFQSNGYPVYRRRDNGQSIIRDNHELNNRHVVPHNRYLLERYNCHINVEHCTNVTVAKYMFKYIFKGVCVANVRLDMSNEIQVYENCRFLSTPEAAWNLAAFEMHHHSHSILRLSVHLENEQRIYVQENVPLENVDVNATQSTLMGWFQSNAEHKRLAEEELLGRRSTRKRVQVYKKHGLHLTYPRYCEMFTWKKDIRVWKKRELTQRFPQIGRMYTVNIQNTELYALRLLLLNVPGCTGYEDLKTFQGTVYNTFNDAAHAQRLLVSDNEFDDAIAEAVTLLESNNTTPAEIRIVFAMMLQWNYPEEPGVTWNRYKDYMSSDLMRKYHCNREQAQIHALADIKSIMVANGGNFNWSVYRGMPNLPPDYIVPIDNDDDEEEEDDRMDIEDHIDQVARLLQDRRNKFNSAQKEAFDTIIKSLHEHRDGVNTGNARCFFIDGPGGTGKTFLYETIYYYCIVNGFSCVVTAWTGIAASLLPTGKTVHSTFGLPLNISETTICNVTRTNTTNAQTLSEANIILWDECSMAESLALTAVNRLLKDLCKTTVPYGNKVMVMGGDFRQILPVVPYGDRTEIVGRSIITNDTWSLFQPLRLHRNERTLTGERRFASYLKDVGEGKTINELGLHTFKERTCVNSVHQLITKIYGRRSTRQPPTDCAILCPRHDACRVINDKVNDRIIGPAKVYTACNRIVEEDEETRRQYTDEYLAAQDPSGLPPHLLKLKKGSIVMAVRNLNANMGLCNGSRLQIKSIHEHLIRVIILNGTNKGNTLLLPRLDISTSDQEDVSVNFTRRQFPIIMSFAMTINKSQGQTLRKVGLYLESPVFAHGHLYVAMSRVRRAEDFSVFINHGRLGIALNDRQTKNVVFEEVLDVILRRPQ